MLGVLDWGRRKLIMRTSRTKRSSDFIALLEEIDRRYGPKLGVMLKPVVLVLDNGPIHTSKASRAALAAAAPWFRSGCLRKTAPGCNEFEGSGGAWSRLAAALQPLTAPIALPPPFTRP